MSFLRFHFFTLLWAGIIILMSFYPGKDLPKVDFWQLLTFDKFMHISCYMLLFFLMNVGGMKQYGYQIKRYRITGITFTTCIFYGILVEILQPILSEDRFFDFFDIFANTIGCIFGIFLFKFVYSKSLN